MRYVRLRTANCSGALYVVTSQVGSATCEAWEVMARAVAASVRA